MSAPARPPAARGPGGAATTGRRVRITLHYDGAGFSGWQVQPGKRTVQGELEAVLSRLADRPTRVAGAGRTDTGVHAAGQVAAATVPARWTPEALQRALNALLPPDIWVREVREAPPDFDPRRHAVSRAYVYRVGTSPFARSPFHRRWCWPVPDPLDASLLAEAAELLLGTHSFRAFARSGQPERGDRCTIHAAGWVPWRLGLAFHIVGDRFLHHMVRYLVGTMVDVARGRRPLADVAALLANEPGLETSPPAPAGGLFLVRVRYPGDPETDAPPDSELP